MNCCFAASLYSLSLTFVGTHPFAPTRCLVGGELVHSLYSSRRCSRQISLPPRRSMAFSLLFSHTILPPVQLFSSPCLLWVWYMCPKTTASWLRLHIILGRLLTSGAVRPGAWRGTRPVLIIAVKVVPVVQGRRIFAKTSSRHFPRGWGEQ